MLESGYSLNKVELLNWGNFHGYQKFNLKDINQDGLLFSPPSASAILGANGSGKSTLIDGIMITLLPFENLLKLGVTNDLEIGGGGGRTIKDYVLGKHSSTHSHLGTQIESGYGRKDGCSIFLMVFQHNRNINKYITVGRVWWYQNYQVSDTHLAFIGYDPLHLQQFFINNEVPKSPKVFKSIVKESFPHFQIYDVMQNYFSALSSSFGNISKEDLKILNRAFYVKSISQIDQFIRDNMLLEQESPHLDLLLENVRNGKEIALAIQNCEKKIDLIQKIMKHLEKLELVFEKRKDLDQQIQLCSYYSSWIEFHNTKMKLEILKKEVLNLLNDLPQVQKDLTEIESTYKAIQLQIVQNDLEARLQKIDIELQYLQKQISQIEVDIESKSMEAARLNLKIPNLKNLKDMSDQENKIFLQVEEISNQTHQLLSDLENFRNTKYQLEGRSEILKSEIKHLSETRSLLPMDLYSIKQQAIEKLKIPKNKIFFVGELIQVKKSFLTYRKAIESVLFPISRNLLVHPEYLNSMTQWLDQTGLRSDIVVKRISEEELDNSGYEHGIFNFKGQETDQILNMIEIYHEKEHDFSHYLKRWLFEVFNYELVSYKEFKQGQGKLVTNEGLVKTDIRTMRKLKAHFSFSLGWDNAEELAIKTKELVALQDEYLNIKNKIEELGKVHQENEEKIYLLRQLKAQLPIYLSYPKEKERFKNLFDDKNKLIKENPGYEELKRQEEKLHKTLKELQKRESSIQSQIENKKEHISKLEYLIPEEEVRLKSLIQYAALIQIFSSEELLTEKLFSLKEMLETKQIHRLNYEANLKSEYQKLENQSETSRNLVLESLNLYKNNFDDPNLPFQLPISQQLSSFKLEWEKAFLRLSETELPKAQENWKRFFDQILMDSVKDMINEVKSKLYDVEQNINSINEVLKLTNFEDLVNEKRYLRIHYQTSADERIRQFKRNISDIEKLLGSQVRNQVESQSKNIMQVLLSFVEEFQNDLNYRNFVTDVRNHYYFEVHSLRRMEQEDQLVEVFSGAKKDAKSSAQTTHLAYTLLASCLAYRFKFNDPQLGQETPRLLILDEFGGKFDNDKPKDIIKLLDKMGFQSVLVSPMTKADLLAGAVSHFVFVYKVSATQSKVNSVFCSTKEDYVNYLKSKSMSIQNDSVRN